MNGARTELVAASCQITLPLNLDFYLLFEFNTYFGMRTSFVSKQSQIRSVVTTAPAVQNGWEKYELIVALLCDAA